MPKKKEKILTFAEAEQKNTDLDSPLKYGVAEVHETLERAKEREASMQAMGAKTFISESRHRTDWFAVWVR